ncbi:hypothetical protein WJX75_009853 [Coccomyxa subellipsoidea]|uniref:Peptidase S54 rhomboid domain-containing protein n=1 Tax=Coccomyxa subellipsoidea TaxID=248742 RepID=A0ABR2Z1U0_9CHLO
MLANSSSAVGVFWLLVVNLVLFAADYVFEAPWVSSLYLWHPAPHWWQFLTAAFCHSSWDHLSSNLFMPYTFEKVVEEEEGPGALWFTYIFCSVGTSAASFLAARCRARATYSLGASGAVFGLFAVAVLLKLRLNLQKLVECLVLGQFVVKEVLQEVVSAQNGGAMMGASKVGHIAHLAGAVMGVALILLVQKYQSPK